MTNAMEALYNEWLESHNDTPRMNSTIDVLCAGKDFKESSSKYYMLSDAFNEENKNAFYAGFKTAVQLLMGGGQA